MTDFDTVTFLRPKHNTCLPDVYTTTRKKPTDTNEGDDSIRSGRGRHCVPLMSLPIHCPRHKLGTRVPSNVVKVCSATHHARWVATSHTILLLPCVFTHVHNRSEYTLSVLFTRLF